ncbi:hypothetical protein NL676_018173 [Syzygium grande]|nr:hypothetical protein NL676_018173 [Syzygium grande]
MEQERPLMLGDGLLVKERPAGVALGGDSVRGLGIVAARPSREEVAPCAGNSRNVGALVAASSKKVAVAGAIAVVVDWLS